MAFQASRRNRAIEVRTSIGIRGTVSPAEHRPVRNWKLVQQVLTAPIEKRLPSATRTRDECDALGPDGRIGHSAEHRGLEESAGRRVHPEIEMRIRRAQNVLAGPEAARER